jgi:ankyrin repeat protein
MVSALNEPTPPTSHPHVCEDEAQSTNPFNPFIHPQDLRFPIGSFSYQNKNKSRAENPKKSQRGKKKSRLRGKALQRAIIEWTGLRMIVESTFGNDYGWQSELLEKSLVNKINPKASRKSEMSHFDDMIAFLTKHPNNIEEIQQFFDFLNLCSGNWGQVLLLIAIQKENLEAVRRLLEENRVDPNFIDENGRSPLLYSSCIDNGNIVSELLKYKANVHFHDRQRRNALWYAVENSSDSVIEHLVTEGAKIPDQTDGEDTDSNLFTFLEQDRASDTVKIETLLSPHRPQLNSIAIRTKPDISTSSSSSNLGSIEQRTATGSANIPSQAPKDPAEESYVNISKYCESSCSDADMDDDDCEESTEEDDISSTGSLCYENSEDNPPANDMSSSGSSIRSSGLTIGTTITLWLNEAVNQVMRHSHELIYSCAGPSNNGNATSNITNASSSSPSSSSSTGQQAGFQWNYSSRRRSSNKDNEDDDDDEEEGGGNRRLISVPTVQIPSKRKPLKQFACPYYLRYSKKFVDVNGKCCNQGPGWDTLHRLK